MGVSATGSEFFLFISIPFTSKFYSFNLTGAPYFLGSIFLSTFFSVIGCIGLGL